MKASRPTVGAMRSVSLAVALPYTTAVNSQQTTATEARSRFDNKTRRERFTSRGAIDPERRLTTTSAAASRPKRPPASTI